MLVVPTYDGKSSMTHVDHLLFSYRLVTCMPIRSRAEVISIWSAAPWSAEVSMLVSRRMSWILASTFLS